jgi:ribose 1,5-bisphosphokinase PhnN
MAGNSRPSFNKRLKERARQEKQAEKIQKRLQRKAEKEEGTTPKTTGNPTITYDEEGQPQALDFHDF